MASLRSKVVEALIRIIDLKGASNRVRERIAAGKLRAHAVPTRRMRDRLSVASREVGGRTVWTIGPRDSAPTQHVFYLHGGSYVSGCAPQHWTFLSRLVDDLGCSVTVPDYPLAPEHTAKDAFAMALPLYREHVGRVGAANLTLMGDSAGGGFCLALAQRLRDEGDVQPAKIILLSPWLDVSMSNPEIAALDAVDPFLGVAGHIDCGKMWAGDLSLTDPLVSPLHGRLDGLAPITVYIGTRELFLADCRKLKRKAFTAGIPLDYREYEDMVHVWMILGVPFPESTQALEEIRASLRA